MKENWVKQGSRSSLTQELLPSACQKQSPVTASGFVQPRQAHPIGGLMVCACVLGAYLSQVASITEEMLPYFTVDRGR